MNDKYAKSEIITDLTKSKLFFHEFELFSQKTRLK